MSSRLQRHYPASRSDSHCTASVGLRVLPTAPQVGRVDISLYGRMSNIRLSPGTLLYEPLRRRVKHAARLMDTHFVFASLTWQSRRRSTGGWPTCIIAGYAGEHVLADKGYDAQEFRQHILELGMIPVIPPARTARHPPTMTGICTGSAINLIEIATCFATRNDRLKWVRDSGFLEVNVDKRIIISVRVIVDGDTSAGSQNTILPTGKGRPVSPNPFDRPVGGRRAAAVVARDVATRESR